MENVRQENKMGVMPVNRLLISMSLPMIASMIVQALYNVVDSIFVSRISENALTAVSLAFPAQNLLIAVSAGTCVGINALLSKSLGEKNYKKADRIAQNGVFIMFISFIVFFLLGLLFTDLFYKVQTDIPEIIEGGVAYTRICLMSSFGIFMQFTFERMMQATGKTIYTMYTQGVGAIINIILDPILIFGLLGFPKMGVAGAAWATVIGQICAGFFAYFLNHKLNKEINITLKGVLKPDRGLIKSIYMIAIPSIIMQSIGSIMTFCLNKILIALTETAVAVFGVYFKLQSFIFMPIFGLNNGMVPIISFNYGAKNKERMMKTIKLSTMYAVIIMFVGLAIMQFIPDKLLMLFEASENMLKIGIPALRIISTAFIFAGYCIIIGSVFQALGKAWYSMIVSLARQLFVLLPVAWLLAQSGNVDLVWWCYPIAEIISVILTTVFFVRIYKNTIKTLED